MATAMAAGTTQIIATVGSVQGKTGLNVALTGISVSPANPTVALGLTQQFAASGTFAGLAGSLDISNAVVWGTVQPSVADISLLGLAATHSQGSTLVTASSGAGASLVSGSTTLMVGPPALTGVTVTPAIASILINDTKQFTATGTYTDGSTQDLTSMATWGTSMASVASVSTTGLATGLTAGQSSISAQFSTFMGSALLNVRKTSKFSYAVNASDGTVSGYVLDEHTGRLRPNGYMVLPEQGLSANTDPAGKFLYLGAAGDSKIFGYVIGQDGSLAPVPGSVSAFGTSAASPSGLAITPDGKYLYAADRSGPQFSGIIDAFMINANGSLTPLPVPSYATGGNPDDAVIDPTGKFLYVASFGTSSISEYQINSDGSLTALGTIPSGGSRTQALAIDPAGKFLIAANNGSANVGVFAIGATGNLTAVAGSPFATGQGPVSVRIDPTGTYVFVANQADGTISAFTLNSATGALTAIAGSPFAGAGSPSALAIDAAVFYLVATNGAVNESAVFSIDPASGALALLRSVRTRKAPASVVLTPGSPAVFAPAFAEVASTTTTNPAITGGVTSFTVDPATGAPSEIGGATIPPNGVFAVAANLAGNLLYAADGQALGKPPQGTVYAFQLSSFGGLTSANADASGNNPEAIAVDPSSRFVYTANTGSGNISGYNVTSATTGVISSMPTSPFATGAGPDAIVIDPTGRFLYVGNFTGVTSDAITAYAIDSASGSLSSAAKPVLTPGPRAFAVHPDGKFLFAVNSGQDTVTTFSVASDTGALSQISTSGPFGSNLAEMALSGDGRFLYVSSLGNQQTGQDVDQIYGFSVDEATGALSAVPNSPTAWRRRKRAHWPSRSAWRLILPAPFCTLPTSSATRFPFSVWILQPARSPAALITTSADSQFPPPARLVW